MEQNTNTTNSPQVTSGDNGLAIVAYLTLIGFIIALVMNNDKKNPLVSYHLRQALGLFIVGIIFSVLSFIPYVGYVSMIAYLLLFVLFIMGIINAANKEQKPVPVLGNMFQDWFKNTF